MSRSHSSSVETSSGFSSDYSERERVMSEKSTKPKYVNDTIPHYGLTICGSLSIIAAGVLVAYYIISKKSRTFGFRLVFPLFFYDLIWSINIVVPSVYLFFDPNAVIGEVACQIQGFVKLFSMLASFFSTAAISWTLYATIILKKQIRMRNPMIYFAKLTVFLPFTIALIPLVLKRYDHLKPLESVMCFLVVREDNDVDNDYLGICMRILFYYTPFALVLIFDMFTVISIQVSFRRSKMPSHDKRDIQNLMLYPIVLLISWIWIIIERCFEVIQNEQVYWLNQIDIPLSTINGFLNALVYGYISLDPFGLSKRRQNIETTSNYSETSSISLNSSTMNHPKYRPGFIEQNNSFDDDDEDESSLTFHINTDKQQSDD